jgi:hypothetical protein
VLLACLLLLLEASPRTASQGTKQRKKFNRAPCRQFLDQRDLCSTKRTPP